MSKGQRPFYKGVDFKQFTNKDGYAKGGKEYKVSEKVLKSPQPASSKKIMTKLGSFSLEYDII